MDFAKADLMKNLSMLGRAVSLVLQEVVSGKLAVIHFHNPIPRNLGNNGGRGYGDAQRIALHQVF